MRRFRRLTNAVVDTVLAVLDLPDLEAREKTPLGPDSEVEHFEYEMLDASDEAR